MDTTRVRTGVTGEQRWAAQGVARVLEAAHVDVVMLDGSQVEGAAADAGLDVLVAVQPGEAQAQAWDRTWPESLPVLWLGAARVPHASPARIHGALSADAPDAHVVAAVHALAAGLHVADDAHRGRLQPASPLDGPAEPLTARELEVLELLAKGLANREIAAVLGVTMHTAKFHVARILEKLGAATRTEAVRQALRTGLIGL